MKTKLYAMKISYVKKELFPNQYVVFLDQIFNTWYTYSMVPFFLF